MYSCISSFRNDGIIHFSSHIIVLSKFLKAPLLVVLNEESFEDNLINHNYGYVLTDKENRFAIKMYTRVNINMTQASVGDTMIFDKIIVDDYSELVDRGIYFLR